MDWAKWAQAYDTELLKAPEEPEEHRCEGCAHIQMDDDLNFYCMYYGLHTKTDLLGTCQRWEPWKR